MCNRWFSPLFLGLSEGNIEISGLGSLFVKITSPENILVKKPINKVRPVAT
jgi:hypothetical protein